jgi:uncharacterized membrane protein YGL010W
MRSAEAWFDAYGASHQNPLNKAIHWVCIPAITWSLLALMQGIPFPVDAGPFAHWGTVFAVVAMVFYASLSPTILLGMTLMGGACLWLNAALLAAGAPLYAIAIAVFVISWVAQFIGHYIEGEKPSFFEDLQFLLVGPAWLLQFAYGRVGIPLMA